jgi:hypothetical protein
MEYGMTMKKEKKKIMNKVKKMKKIKIMIKL